MADFGIGETALIIGAIGAAAGTTTAAVSAEQQNKAANASKQAAQRAAQVQSKQVSDAAKLEQFKVLRRQEQIRGRIRLASAEGGVADFGSLSALNRQNDLDSALNLDVLRTNTASASARIGSDLNAELARLSGSYRNTLLSGFEGTLGGAAQGINLGGGLSRARDNAPVGPFDQP
jgi:hypothetical protein